MAPTQRAKEQGWLLILRHRPSCRSCLQDQARPASQYSFPDLLRRQTTDSLAGCARFPAPGAGSNSLNGIVAVHLVGSHRLVLRRISGALSVAAAAIDASKCRTRAGTASATKSSRELSVCRSAHG